MQEQIICNKEDLVAIADAVRANNGSTETYNVPELSVAAVEAINSNSTGNGLSAYEVAVKNGFIGSESEWLASLVGPAGEPGKDANVTSENIKSALGYTPANAETVSQLSEKIVSPWSGKSWVALGTSITDVNSGYGKYPPHLVRLSGLTLTNKGVSGASAGGHILYYAQNTSQLSTADLVTVEGFVNDYASARPLGEVGDTVPYHYTFTSPAWDNGGSDAGTFAGACYQIFRNVMTKAPKAVVILLTDHIGRYIASTGAHYERSATNSLGLTQDDYRKMAMDVAEYMGVRVIDTCTKSMINEEHSGYYADHIHHSELGGEQFAQTVWMELKNIAPLIITTHEEPEEPEPEEPEPEEPEPEVPMEYDVDISSVGYTDNYRYSTSTGEMKAVTGLTAIHLISVDRPTDRVRFELSGIDWSSNSNSSALACSDGVYKNAVQLHVESNSGSWKVEHTGEGTVAVERYDTSRTLNGFKFAGLGKGANAVIKVKHV